MQPGQTVITEGSDFEINNARICVKNQVGKGNSATVYIASRSTQDGEINVAVKVLRPEMVSVFKEGFQKEAQTIQTLKDEYLDQYPGGHFPVPQYYDGILNAPYPFFIEEFIKGKDLKQELIEHGQFPEKEALRLAAQIGRVLVILHNKIQKCYGDIKFENFVVVPGTDQSELKILDWNNLVDLTPTNIQQDLLYVSTYVFYMLTGDSIQVIQIDEQNLKIKQPIQSFESFKSLSIAAQMFFQKALNPEPGRRFENAEDWLKEIHDLFKWWQQDQLALLNGAWSLFDEVKTKPALFDRVYEVQKQAGIACKRKAIGAEDLLNETNQWMDANRFVDRIKRHWDEGDIPTAIEVYQSVRDKVQYQKNAALLFWGVGAQLAKKLGGPSTELSKKLYSSIEMRLKNEYSSAANQFKAVADWLDPALVDGERDTLKSLEDEARLQDLLLKAKDQDIREHNTTLRQAGAYYAQLPLLLQQLVLQSFDVPAMLEESQRQVDVLDQVSGLLEQAKKTDDVDNAARLYKQALALSSNHSSVLTDLKHLVFARFTNDQYLDAQRLARLPHQAGVSDASFDTWFEDASVAASELYALKRQYGQVSLDSLVAQILSYMERYKRRKQDLFFCGDFWNFSSKVFSTALAEHNFKAARSLYDLMNLYGAGRFVENLKSLLDKAQKQLCDDLISQALDILKCAPFDAAALASAETIIASVEKDDFRDEGKVQSARTVLKTKKGAYEANKLKLESIQTQLIQAQEQFKILELGAELCTSANRQVYYQEMGRILGTYLDRLAELKKLRQNDGDLSTWQAWAEQKTSQETLTDARAFLEEQARVKKILETKEPEKPLETTPVPSAEKDGNNSSNKPDDKNTANSKGKRPDKRASSPKRLPTLWVGVVAILVVLVAAGLIWRYGLFNSGTNSTPAASPTMISSGSTTTQIEPPTATPAPETATPAPTATATSPAPSATSTSAPMSKFAITALPDKVPALAELTGPGPFYLIDDSVAKFEGKWAKLEPAMNGINGSFKYIDGIGNLDDASAVWAMDIPLTAGGPYEVFILDLASNSGATLPISYKVLKSGNEVAPVAGSGSIKMLKSTEQSGKDVWRSIGIYKLDEGDIPSVRLDLPKGYIPSGEMVGADAVLFVRLPSFKTDAGPGKDLVDKKQIALMVIDDDQASFDPTEGWKTTKSENVWSDSFHQIDLKDTPVIAKWTFTLPSGDYNLKMFIPQELTARVDFTITLDGQPVKGLETLNIPENSGAGGTHYPATGWKVTVPAKDQGSKGLVEITMKSADKATGMFACDAVIVLAAQ